MNLVSGGLIEIEDYNDIALEVNRLFSDNTVSLVWSTSNLILNDTAAGAGEIAGATRLLSPQPLASDFLVVTVNDATLFVDADYTITYTNPVTITFLDPLPGNAVLKVWNRNTHRYGWGQQASVYPITAGDPVLADEATLQAYLEANVNNLIDKVNIMETRIDGPSALTRVAPGALIYASDKTLISSTISSDVTSGSNYWINEVATSFNDIESFTRTDDWNDTLVGEMRHTWDDYDDFRYFFNSGNELRLALTMTGDPANQGYNNWNQVVTALGTVSLNYDTCFQSGRNGITANLGAYKLTGTYQTIFTSGSPETPVDEFDMYDAYGEYSTLVVVIEARIVENAPAAGNLSLDIRVTLNDDDLNTTTSGTTTYTGGYLLADNITNNSAVFDVSANVPTLSVLNSFESTATMSITNISQGNPGVVTVADTSALIDGSTVIISDVVGMTEVNTNSYVINVINATTFDIGVNTTGFTAYTSGGTVTYPTDDV